MSAASKSPKSSVPKRTPKAVPPKAVKPKAASLRAAPKTASKAVAQTIPKAGLKAVPKTSVPKTVNPKLAASKHARKALTNPTAKVIPKIVSKNVHETSVKSVPKNSSRRKQAQAASFNQDEKAAKREALHKRAQAAASAAANVTAGKGDVSQQNIHLPGPGEIFGQAAWLMMMSQTHKHLFIGDMEWLLTPPIMLKQFRIWRNNNIPFAFASWACLNEDSIQRLKSGNRRLSPADWNNGDKAWLIDLVCPHGDPEAVLRDLKENVFSNDPLMTLRPGSDGKGVMAVEVKIEDLQPKGE